MITKILAPLDGATISQAALPWVERAANRAGASIHLLTVLESAEADIFESIRSAKSYLREQKNKIESDGPITEVSPS
jgi:nucleotide-binding universal stress UspA family protein